MSISAILLASPQILNHFLPQAAAATLAASVTGGGGLLTNNIGCGPFNAFSFDAQGTTSDGKNAELTSGSWKVYQTFGGTGGSITGGQIIDRGAGQEIVLQLSPPTRSCEHDPISINAVCGSPEIVITGTGGFSDIIPAGTVICTLEQPPADTIPPVLTLPPDQTVEAQGPNGAAVTFTVTANEPLAAPVSCNPASGSTFPIGSTPVTCNATDLAGKS